MRKAESWDERAVMRHKHQSKLSATPEILNRRVSEAVS